jgi:IclR family transcriptional regulator, KDG regulon repressor
MKLARTTTGKYVVEAVVKSLDVLEAFNKAEDLTLNEISRRVGLNKSRTFRLLHTLAEYGYVERTSDGVRYKLGVKLFELAANVRRDIRDVARPFMLDLQGQFNEMVNLGVLDGSDVLYLDIVESSRPFRMSATVGCRMPAYQTSMGKAMLACLEADDPSSASSGLIRKLPPGQLEAVCRELETIRRRGYAVDDEENERGVGCVGAVVMDVAGHPLAALSVSGPEHRVLDQEKIVAEALVAACRGISKNLGLSASGIGRVSGARLARAVGMK